jgi:DNA-binding transcriptional ArsR family regulator
MVGSGGGKGDRRAQALAIALGHPLRERILQFLGERSSASGKEIATALSEAPSTVSEHLRWLSDKELVDVIESKNRRGAVERFYSYTSDSLLLQPADMAALPRKERLHLVEGAVRLFVNNVTEAMSSPDADISTGSSWYSTTLSVDAQGWDDLSAIHQKALKEVERVRAESARRLKDGTSERIVASSSIFLFYIP